MIWQISRSPSCTPDGTGTLISVTFSTAVAFDQARNVAAIGDQATRTNPSVASGSTRRSPPFVVITPPDDARTEL
jgi:hypothetical protein